MKKLIITAICAIAVLASCTSPSVPDSYSEAQRKPKIYPEYTDVTIPCNIAPMNFMVTENCDEAVARLTYGNEESVYGDGTKIIIPEDDWTKILSEAKGKSIKVDVFTRNADSWTKYKTFSLNVANDPIDPYISYRLIPPSYVAYEKLTINQRNLTNFDEKVIYSNMLVSTEENGQCINCHSYQNYKTDNMQFHMRQGYGGTMIVVGTKKQAQDAVKTEAERCGMYYVNERWLGGMLTNFKTIQSRIQRLKNIEKMEEDGTFDVLPKKEVIQLKKEQEKLQKNLGGIKDMKRIPDAIFVVDPKKESICVQEAHILGIPLIGIVDTNCDPEELDYVIPGNDDAIRAVKLIVSKMADAVIAANQGETAEEYEDVVADEAEAETTEEA